MKRAPALGIAGLCFIPLTLWAIPSADLWWLLAEGRFIATTGHLPLQDPFAYTTAGQTWHNDQWLSGLIAYALYCVHGLLALQIAKVALLCLTFALAVRSAQRNAPFFPALVAGLLCLSFASGRFFFDVRSYLWTYLFIVLWWDWLQSERDLLWPFAVSAALWANLHAGITGGLLLLALTWGGRRTRRDAARLALAVAASLLNPGGPNLLLHAVRLLRSDWGVHLNEWQPLWRSPGLYTTFLLFWFPTVALIGWRRRDWRAAPLLGVALLSLTGWRHIPLFCWLTVGLWAEMLAPLLKRAPAAVAIVLWLGRCGWDLSHTDLAGLSLENHFFPRWACEFLAANPQLGPRLFHPYGVGGYLIFRLAPTYQVAIDGRAAQVYDVAAYRDYLRADNNPAVFSTFATSHAVNAVLTFASESQTEVGPGLLAGNAAWKLAYQDPDFNVYVPASVDLGTLHRPDNPYTLCAAGQPDRALQLDPHNAQALFLKGTLMLRSGDGAGVKWLERALDEDSRLAGAHLNLAIYYVRTDPARARREAVAELEVNPSSAPARQLLLDMGVR